MFANLAMLLEQFSSNTTTSSVNKNINAPCRVAYKSNQGNLIFRGGIRTYCVCCVQLSQHFCWRVWFNSEFSLCPTITITVMARRSETELKIRLHCNHFNLKIIFTQNTVGNGQCWRPHIILSEFLVWSHQKKANIIVQFATATWWWLPCEQWTTSYFMFTVVG